MRLLSNLSIKKRLLAVTFLASAATLLLLGVAFATYSIRSYRRTLVRQLSTQAEIVGFHATSALVFRDEKAAAETLTALQAEPLICFAGIYTPDGKPFARYVRPGCENRGDPSPQALKGAESPRFTSDRLEIARRIGPKDRPVGFVYLRAVLSELRDRIVQYVGITAAFLTVCLFASLAISSTLQKTISEPILDLVGVARTVAVEKRYDVRASARNRDELGVLVEAFNGMLVQIQRRDTELQTLNQQLLTRTQELGRKNEEVEAFVYIVSHDLRGPLVNLQGFSHELARSCQALADRLRVLEMPKDAGEELRELAEKEIPDALRFILASSNKFERLINALLQLSRSGRQEYRLEPLEMGDLAATTLDSLRLDVEKSGAEVLVGELPEARGDATAVGQILSNLIVNAVRYLQPGRPGRIEIGGVTENSFNRYWVRDNGVGIPETARKKLFQVFQRFHPKLAAGEGMGLATVKRIVERHGGKVWAESEEGTGTTFLFTLPSVATVPKETR